MSKFLCLLVLGLTLAKKDNSITLTIKLDSSLFENKDHTKEQRKLHNGMPYVTSHIIHHQPYISSGYGSYSNYGPLILPPPSPMLAMPPMVPPPPPIFTTGQLPIQNAYHIIHYPQHMASPWNINAYPHVFNPYLGNHWAGSPMSSSAYGSIPYGLHPFSYPGVGYPYGMSPYYNPYMSMMYTGSMDPYLGSSIYPNSYVAGAYGMYGASNPLNLGETININGGSSPDEDIPANNVSLFDRRLDTNATDTVSNESKDKQDLALDLQDAKQNLIKSLENSLKKLKLSVL